MRNDPLRIEPPAHHLRVRWRLARQDRRSAALARRHGALGLLMSAERLSDVTGPACRPDSSYATARSALDVLWRTLHRDASRGPANWNPGLAHVGQAADVWRWAATVSWRDLETLLIASRRAAADEFVAARTGHRPRTARGPVPVPSL